jgi:hypothetical protein
MRDNSEAFIAFDTSKLRNAVAVAEGGRSGEVRFLGEIENTGTATAKMAGTSPAMTNERNVIAFTFHTSSVAVTGTWSDGWVQPRASRVMVSSETRSARAGLTQMWSSRRPLSAAAQSGAR